MYKKEEHGPNNGVVVSALPPPVVCLGVSGAHMFFSLCTAKEWIGTFKAKLG